MEETFIASGGFFYIIFFLYVKFGDTSQLLCSVDKKIVASSVVHCLSFQHFSVDR